MAVGGLEKGQGGSWIYSEKRRGFEVWEVTKFDECPGIHLSGVSKRAIEDSSGWPCPRGSRLAL